MGERVVAFRQSWFLPDCVGWSPRGYEALFRWAPWATRVRCREEAAVLTLLDSVVARGQRILEVGPGTGHYTLALARRCASVVAAEPSAAMREYLLARLARAGIDNVQVRAARLPGPLADDTPFDGVLAVGVLNYVPELAASLRSLVAAMQPGGWAILTFPLRSAEGRLYALAELVSRRRVYLTTPKEAAALARQVGLQVQASLTAGNTPHGLTLVSRAIAAPDTPASWHVRACDAGAPSQASAC